MNEKIYKLIQYAFLEINKIELLKKETETNKIEYQKKKNRIYSRYIGRYSKRKNRWTLYCDKEKCKILKIYRKKKNLKENSYQTGCGYGDSPIYFINEKHLPKIFISFSMWKQ